MTMIANEIWNDINERNDINEDQWYEEMMTVLILNMTIMKLIMIVSSEEGNEMKKKWSNDMIVMKKY